jgi:OmpA-OmpF porin, OOP family
MALRADPSKKRGDPRMKPVTTLLAGAAAVALLSGCANMYRYERTTDRGSTPFTQALATEYRDLWTYEAKEMYDWIDAEHFAFKSQAAARGETPLPARVDNWNIEPRYRADLQQGRERLMRALNGGGRERAPKLAARAQVAYDCWMEQQEENWQLDHIAACRKDYEQAIAALEGTLAPRPVAQAAPPQPAAPAQPAPAQPTELRVFFDWDKATLDQTAIQVLDTATRQMRSAMGGTPGAAAGASAGAGGPTIVIVEGHADKSGPDDYNMRLSQRRAEAVRQALIERGWPAERIEIRAMGEEVPLVETADGVREPANRRVRIAFQTR